MRPLLAPGKSGFRGNGGGFGGVSFSAEAIALFAAMDVAPSGARKTTINNLIVALKNDGIWAKLGIFYVIAAHDAQAARLNWKLPGTNSLVLTSAPVFTVDRGYKGDGVDDDLRPGLAFNAVPSYAQNNAHVSVWTRTQSGEDTTEWGDSASSEHLLRIQASTNEFIGRINTAVNLLFANAASVGHFLFNRTDSSNVQAYKNGTSIGSRSGATSAALNANAVIFMKGASSNPSTRQMAECSMGASLSATEAEAFYNALQTYMTAVGA